MREARRRTFPEAVQSACLCVRAPLASHDVIACHRLKDYSDHLTSKDQTRGETTIPVRSPQSRLS
jgi:hypothetical protein